MSTSLTWADVHARRLERHGLAEPVPAARLVDQVGVMCGAHAQVMSAAELSIGVRVASVTRAAVREALSVDRSLVKTYGPRGTVHLLPASDLAVWTGALGAALAPPRGDRGARMTPDQVEQVVAAIGAALEDAELTVGELDSEVVARTGPWAGDLVMPAFTGMWPRWRQLIGEAARRGVLCFGADRGRQVTYTSPRRWLPGFEPAEGRTALAEVVRRYLRAYGPATPQEFARWLGAPPGLVVGLFRELGSELEQVEVEERRRGSSRATPRGRPNLRSGSGCSPITTRTELAATRASRCSRAVPPSAPSSGARRARCPSCWSTGSWRGSGNSGERAAGSR